MMYTEQLSNKCKVWFYYVKGHIAYTQLTVKTLFICSLLQVERTEHHHSTIPAKFSDFSCHKKSGNLGINTSLHLVTLTL